MGNSNGRQFGSYLTKKDIERLQRRFLRVTGGRDLVYISQLQMMPELCGNPYIVHIFQLFDTDKDGAINIDEFTRGVQYLATLSDPEEQYKFAFKLYDTDEDGFIRQRELYSMLKQLGTGNVSDAQLDQVVRCTIEEYDKDGDHALSLSEFKALIHTVEAQNKLSLGFY